MDTDYQVFSSLALILNTKVYIMPYNSCYFCVYVCVCAHSKCIAQVQAWSARNVLHHFAHQLTTIACDVEVIPRKLFRYITRPCLGLSATSQQPIA